jgi:long-chain acyl-CoA synthetase
MGPTLIGLLQESVVKYASLAALKTRNPDGSFLTLTFAELYQAVRELGTGLISIGLQPKKHVAIVAENNHRWLVSDLAILGCGGVDVPLSAHISDRELSYILSHSDCELALVESQAVLSRLLAVRRHLPRLRKIVCFDLSGPKPRVETEWGRILIYSWDEVVKKGKTKIGRGERQFDLRAAGVVPGDIATLLYTSGTTGKPKGVMLSHGNIMHNVMTVNSNINPAPGMIWLSVLPVWHSFERTVEYCSLYFGSTIAYSQPSEWKIFDDLRSLKPEYLVVVPAILESIQKSIDKRIGFAQQILIRFERFYLVFSGFVMGRFPRFRREERFLEIFAAILPLIILSPIKLISYLFLRRGVKYLMGGNLRAIVCGGGALPAYVDRFFAALGVSILEGYGLTEAAPIVSVRVEKSPVLGTVGKPLPYTEIKIAGENGEELAPGKKGAVLIKGPQVMQGYYKDPEATSEAVSPDGWLATGDAGMLTLDGNLVVTGRMKHAITLRSGEKVEPEPIELVLQESPYIQEAVVVGDKRESLGLLIAPQMDTLRRFAQAKRIPYSDDRELVRNPAVFRLYQEEVQARLVNNGIGFPGGRAAKLAILPAGFEVGKELTRTLTKKREVISEIYGGVIERLYRS